LLGDIWTTIPLPVPGTRQSLSAAFELRSAIERASSDFTFDVRDVEYAADLRWWPAERAPVQIVIGERGLALVDAPGSARARFIGLRYASPHAYRRQFAWSVLTGPVVDAEDVDAGAVLDADATWHAEPLAGRAGALAAAARVRGVFDGASPKLDIAVGPRIVFAAGPDIDAALVLEYQRSRNPLGIGHSALLLGFEYAEHRREPRRGDHDHWASDRRASIDGAITTGAGESQRALGGLRLRFLSPVFAWRTRGVIDVDANVLTAAETDDLFYLYHAGLERVVGRHAAGVYFYHRSNHQLGQAGQVTNMNVLEFGAETDGWGLPGWGGSESRLGTIDARARVGALLDGSFGEERRWHVRGGVRWTASFRRPWEPFVQIEAEAGEIARRRAAVGLANGPTDLGIEYWRDDQLFSRDRRAVLVVARYGL
jgi:hypothetical protein